MSTSGFESGAYTYAKEHGIALLQIIDKTVMHIQNAYEPENEERAQKQFLISEWIRRQPAYYAYEYSSLAFPDKRIYPPKSYVKNLQEQFAKDFEIALDN